MMIKRTLQPHLLRLFQSYPVVTVTGPRQSGKTTLCRAAFPKMPYVNLESPDERLFASEDPRSFLKRYGEGAVIDEVQRAPELLSYIQVHVDELRRNSLFVLTGSQQLHVSEAISQSLAGRTALLRLLPFSLSEASRLKPDLDLETMLQTGFYPRIYDHGLDPNQALGDYFETYVERDVRQLVEVRNLSGFRTFVRLCAGRIGQLLNLRSLGSDAGVSHTTARQWLSVLEASFIAFLLPPYHGNVSKRLIKSPKLYFYDVGLAAYLLGIESPSQVFTHPLKGGLFENLVVVEALKLRFNRGKRENLYFYRDSKGQEIDLLYVLANRYLAIEAKAGRTISRQYFDAFRTFRDVFGDAAAGEILVHGGDATGERFGAQVTDPAGFIAILEELEETLVNGAV